MFPTRIIDEDALGINDGNEFNPLLKHIIVGDFGQPQYFLKFSSISLKFY